MKLEAAYISYGSGTIIKVNPLSIKAFPQTINPDNVDIAGIEQAFNNAMGMKVDREWSVATRKELQLPAGTIPAGLVITDDKESMVVSYSANGIAFESK